MDYNHAYLIEPKIDGEPYYCISADGKEISLENYENGLRGFTLDRIETTPKASKLVAKFKAPDGRSYTIEIAPNGNVLKATYYDREPKKNPANFPALLSVKGGPHEQFLRKKRGL